MTRLASFAPVVRPDCRLLILGSLPGATSLAEGRYYAHPRNQFWRLIGAVLDRDLEGQAYQARLAALGEAGVGLWDVVGSAERPGSLDGSIRAAEPNDLSALVSTLLALRAIAFNGGKARALGGPLLLGHACPQLALPSSSPANARMAWPEKRVHWMALRAFLP